MLDRLFGAAEVNTGVLDGEKRGLDAGCGMFEIFVDLAFDALGDLAGDGFRQQIRDVCLSLKPRVHIILPSG